MSDATDADQYAQGWMQYVDLIASQYDLQLLKLVLNWIVFVLQVLPLKIPSYAAYLALFWVTIEHQRNMYSILSFFLTKDNYPTDEAYLNQIKAYADDYENISL